MEPTIYDITLELQRSCAPWALTVKKGDTGRRLRLRLLSGGKAYPITDDCYAVFTAQKPDGTVIYNSCTRESDRFIYDLTPQTTAAAGVLPCELRLYGKDDALLTSAAFTVTVEDTVYTEGDEAVTSAGEATALTRLITQARDTIGEMEKEMEKLLANEVNHAVIDDSKAGADAWSGKNIVDKLCPEFTQTGAVVSCDPVEGYPLGVVTRIEPVQSGSGDPSPENIRPIIGYTSGKLYRQGKNLLEILDTSLRSGYWTDGAGDMSDANSRFILIAAKPVSPNTTYTLSSNLTIYSVWTARAGGGTIKRLAGNNKTAYTFTTPDNCDRIRITLNNTSGEADTVAFAWAQLELGDTATEYAPYQGDNFTMDLGQTVYGGSLDWASGVLTMNWYTKIFDGTEGIELKGSAADNYNNYRFNYWDGDSSHSSKSYKLEAYCSHYPHNTEVYKDGATSDQIGFITNGPNIYFRPGSASEITTVAQFKAFLAEQYAAGTPVQVCYQLTTPITVQLTPTEVLALAGTNYLYADTGDITVTGRADPAAVMEKLTNAIIALGGNV